MIQRTAILLACAVLGGACTSPVEDDSLAESAEFGGRDSAHSQPPSSPDRSAPGSRLDALDVQTPLASLVVRVLDDGSRSPVVGARVSLRDGSPRALTEVPGSHGGLDEMPLTNGEGFATLDVRPGYGFTLQVSHPFGLYGTQTKELSALPPGAERNTRLLVPLLADFALTGRVVASEDGSAIPGAELRLQDIQRSSALHEAVALDLTGEPIAVADERGEFAIPATSWRPRAVLVSAPGRGPAVVWTPERKDPRDGGVEVRLSRAARLRGVLLDAPSESPRPTLSIRANLDLLEQPRAVLPQASYVSWSCELQADGSFSLAGLPPDVPLIAVLPDAHGVLRREPGPILLAPAEEREVTWRLGPGGVLDGRILEADGSPAVGVEIWLLEDWEQPVHRDGYFDDRDRPPADPGPGPARRAWSDEQGGFSFRELAVGPWLVGPAPAESIAPAIEPVRIAPTARRTQIVLALHRGYTLSGRVIDPSGAPVPSCTVWARGTAGEGSLEGRTGAEGVFAIGPLVAGAYVLRAWSEDPEFEARSEPVEAAAGAGDVVLELARGGVIAGTVIYASPAFDKMALIEAHNQDGRISIRKSWAADGEFLVWGLEAGTYYLTAVNDLFGRIGFVGPLVLESGALLEGVEIPIDDAGGTVDLHYRGPVKLVAVTIERDGAKIGGRLVERDSRTFFTVPPGPCIVRVRAHDPDGTTLPPLEFESVHEIHAELGEIVELIVDAP